jgi:hypothetical protein
VNTNDNIYVRPIDGSDGSWTQINGKLIHVSASGNGYIWGVNRNHNIYKCKKPCSGSWIKIDGLLMQIDAGQREVCGVNRHYGVFCRPVDGSGKWKFISSGFKYVTTSGPYNLYGVSITDKLYRCEKPCIGEWIEVDHDHGATLTQCDATVNALFGVDASYSIWRKDIPL